MHSFTLLSICLAPQFFHLIFAPCFKTHLGSSVVHVAPSHIHLHFYHYCHSDASLSTITLSLTSPSCPHHHFTPHLSIMPPHHFTPHLHHHFTPPPHHHLHLPLPSHHHFRLSPTPPHPQNHYYYQPLSGEAWVSRGVHNRTPDPAGSG